MPPLRILFLDQTGQLGGAELMLAEIAGHFGPRASAFLFADGPLSGRLRAHGVRVTVAPQRAGLGGVTKQMTPLAMFRAAPAWMRLVRAVAEEAGQHDLIYANTAKALLIGAAASEWTGKPLVYHLHDLLTAEHFSWLARGLLAVVARGGADAVIANSEASRKALRDLVGRAPPACVIYNGFVTAESVPSGSREEIRRQLGCGPGPLALISGRLTRWKGQHVLFEAAKALPGLHVLVAGAALFTTDDRAYEQEIKAMVSADGLAGRIHFLGHRNDVEKLYSAVDVVVHCSIAPEPFGRVIVEGMLAGKPVVASDAGGVREIIVSDETGLLVPPGDAVALAEALQRVLRTPALAARLGEKGRSVARERFSLSKILSEMEAVVEAVAHSPERLV